MPLSSIVGSRVTWRGNKRGGLAWGWCVVTYLCYYCITVISLIILFFAYEKRLNQQIAFSVLQGLYLYILVEYYSMLALYNMNLNSQTSQTWVWLCSKAGSWCCLARFRYSERVSGYIYIKMNSFWLFCCSSPDPEIAPVLSGWMTLYFSYFRRQQWGGITEERVVRIRNTSLRISLLLERHRPFIGNLLVIGCCGWWTALEPRHDITSVVTRDK